MILSDRDIAKRCDTTRFKHPLVSPFKQANLQPASVDLTLDALFLEPKTLSRIDLADVHGTTSYNQVVAATTYVVQPQTFVLGSTAETIYIPPGLVGRVEGKSSLGRLGLLVHSTAGFIDPGFRGRITLEFYSLNKRAIIMYPGQKICQISFTELTSPAQNPYGGKGLGSKYQDQNSTTPSKYAN